MSRTELRRLGFAVFWILVAVALMFRNLSQNKDVMAEGDASTPRIDTATLVAAVFAAWNFLMWYIAYQNRPVRAEESPLPRRKPLAPREDGPRQFEYNPEFDFHKPESAEPSGLPPADSANGSHPAPPTPEPPAPRIGG